MDFDASSKLADAGSRAKSDVANKLVSMALHRVSQSIAPPAAVRSPAYRQAVRDVFANRCPYCETPLSEGNTILEHLDAMNQFRAGLHVPGNVLPACRRCNLEKRRDDQAGDMSIGISGWELFLQHDGQHGLGCKTCTYWERKWPHHETRLKQLEQSRDRIASFRKDHLSAAARDLRPRLAPLLVELYVEAQRYAEERTQMLVEASLA